MQEGSRAFRMRCCSKDRSPVILEDGQPIGDVGCVILAGFERELQVRAEERRTQFCHQFLNCRSFIAETLATEISVQALLVLRPMRSLVGQRAVIRFRVTEASKGGIWMRSNCIA
jgi:hypothetical protein